MTDFEPDYVTLTTDGIAVSACQALLEDENDVCGYLLKIENNSAGKIQILGKDLNLTDDKGNSYVPSEPTFDGEILELNPGEYFEFEDFMPMFSSCAVLYGTCRIVEETTNRVQDIKIPVLQLVSNICSSAVLN
ncbi:MAG: ApaG domain [Alphaproteobacteria bacterium]|nr:ApaG domain [Alphaproteobacteria bacterium]